MYILMLFKFTPIYIHIYIYTCVSFKYTQPYFGLSNSFTQISKSSVKYASSPFQYLSEKKIFLTATCKAGFLLGTL